MLKADLELSIELSEFLKERDVDAIAYWVNQGADIGSVEGWNAFFEEKGVQGILSCLFDNPAFTTRFALMCGYALLQKLNESALTDLISYVSDEACIRVAQRNVLETLLSHVDSAKPETLAQLESMIVAIVDSWKLAESNVHWKTLAGVFAEHPLIMQNSIIEVQYILLAVLREPKLIETAPAPAPATFIRLGTHYDPENNLEDYVPSTGVWVLSDAARNALGMPDFAKDSHDGLSMKREFMK